jgi:hypothetical protein
MTNFEAASTTSSAICAKTPAKRSRRGHQIDGRQVRLVLAYRDAYPEEIASAIAENRRGSEEWRALHPFIEHPPRA